MDIRVANAPCSWGALEFEGMGGGIAYGQMLDELRDTGYVGTELGDWGYMPTEPTALKEELERRKLAMVGAFVPVALRYQDKHASGEADALKVAREALRVRRVSCRHGHAKSLACYIFRPTEC